jgi:putative glutamine amidotransferase
MNKPVVLVPACNRMSGKHPFVMAGQKYVDAVRLAGCQPLVVPSALPEELDALIDLADGLLLTGSKSNVHPSRFGEGVHNPTLPLDEARDAWTLALIPKALARGLPFFAICRGLQETNVALGGSLHQAVQEVPGHMDHRDDDAAPAEVQYGLAHPIDIERGGLLWRVLGRERVEVNSLHGQGVNRLADGLRVEARAPDGVIEAFSKPDAPGFNLAVQWHPEWQAASNPVSMAMMRAFGEACAEYGARKAGTLTPALSQRERV